MYWYFTAYILIVPLLLPTTLSSCPPRDRSEGRNRLYVAVEPGRNVTGRTIAVQRSRSVQYCAMLCTLSAKCEMFQYVGTSPGSCTMIYISSVDDSTKVFTSSEHNYIYRTDTAEPIFYFCFDSLNNVQLMEGAVKTDFNGLVDEKVNKALKIDKTKNQSVDLGDLSQACITVPDTCGPEGAAVAFWVKLISCDSGSIISSGLDSEKTGVDVTCDDNAIGCTLTLDTGYISLSGMNVTSDWTHVVLNYIGPNNGEGIQAYLDGKLTGSDDTITVYPWFVPGGNGVTIIGKKITPGGGMYASFEIDELAFFNVKLSEAQIQKLYDTDK